MLGGGEAMAADAAEAQRQLAAARRMAVLQEGLPDSFGQLEETLAELGRLLEQRARQYGCHREHCRRLAAEWSAELGMPVTPERAARLMAGLKRVRLARDPGHRDSWLDLLGWLAIAADLAAEEAAAG